MIPPPRYRAQGRGRLLMTGKSTPLHILIQDIHCTPYSEQQYYKVHPHKNFDTLFWPLARGWDKYCDTAYEYSIILTACRDDEDRSYPTVTVLTAATLLSLITDQIRSLAVFDKARNLFHSF